MRSAEEWAKEWDSLQRCPHEPKHDNEKEYPSADAYNACLAEYFRAYARECLMKDREKVAGMVDPTSKDIASTPSVPHQETP